MRAAEWVLLMAVAAGPVCILALPDRHADGNATAHASPSGKPSPAPPAMSPISQHPSYQRKGGIAAWVRARITDSVGSLRWACRALLERVLYQLTIILEANLGLKLVVLWLFSISLVMLGAALLRLGSFSPTWGDAVFRAYALLHNAPGTSVWEYRGAAGVMANILFITGILTFAVTVGTVSSSIHSVFEEVWKADHRIVESDHIVVINWSEMIIPVLRQILAGRLHGQGHSKVVVLAEEDLDMMRDLIRTELGSIAKRVSVRAGNPSSLRHLQKVSVGSAKHILVLSPGANASTQHGSLKSMLTTQVGCIKSLQQIHAAKCGRDTAAHAILLSPKDSAPDVLSEIGFKLITPSSFQQHVLAVAVLQRGLTQVYQEILDQTHGAQLYLLDIATHGCAHLQGLTLDSINGFFPQSVVLGWLSDAEGAAHQERGAKDGGRFDPHERGERRVNMIPGKDERLPRNAQLILMINQQRIQRMMASSALIKCPPRPSPASTPAVTTMEGLGDWMSEGVMGMRPGLGDWGGRGDLLTRASERRTKKARKVLLLNFVNQWELLMAMDTHLYEGTVVTVLVSQEYTLPRAPRFVEVHFKQWGSSVEAINFDAVPDLGAYNVVVILETRLEDGRIVDENDARAVAAMLVIAQKHAAFRQNHGGSGAGDGANLGAAAPSLHFVVSAIRLSSLPVLWATANNNNASVSVVQCNELESGALAQVLWNPDLLMVYHDFLEPSWGVQLEFIMAKELVPLQTQMNFAYLQAKTRALGAIALGVRYADGTVLLAPRMDAPVVLREGDIILLLLAPEAAQPWGSSVEAH